jgi:hypothetical protein
MSSLLTLLIAVLVVGFGLWMHINHYEVLSNGLFLATILYFVGEYMSGRLRLARMTPEQFYQAHRRGTAPTLSSMTVALRWLAAAVSLASVVYQFRSVL